MRLQSSFQDEMTREEVDEAIRQDVLNQQAGADIDPIQVSDVRVEFTPVSSSGPWSQEHTLDTAHRR